MTKNITISANTANRLYWLGRYTERVYLELHLLRRYYDKMIDGAPEEYHEYYKKLEVDNPYPDDRSYRLGFLYDEKNPCSILSGLKAANDNAILLRENIMSETLSYIQMSLVMLNDNKQKENDNITFIQSITDWLLAFWGSAEERIYNERVRNFMKAGKLIEHIDIQVRFNYKYYRIREAFDALKACSKVEKGMFDMNLMEQLDELLTPEQYAEMTPEYRSKLLKFINTLVLV